ncbi:MAG: DMT family transporter [Candidatus Rokuibacteriota bacterium]
MPAPSQTRAYVALFLIATLWGTFPATAKLALDAFPPVFLTAVRCTIASAFLVVLLVRSGADTVRELGAGSIRSFFILGFTGLVISTQISYFGIYHTTAANAAILQTTGPVLVAVAARLYLAERLRPLQKAGAALSVLGVLVVVTSGRLWSLRVEHLRLGDFLTIFALCGWAAYTVYGKHVLLTHSPALTTTAAYLCGTAMIVPLAAVTAPLFPAPALGAGLAWAVVVYQALLGAVAHIWWYRAVQVVGPSRSAVFMNVTPIVGVVLAAVLLAEPIGPWQVAGAALVLAGVALTTRGGGGARGEAAAPDPSRRITPAS